MLEANLALGRLYLEMKSNAQAIRHFEHAAKAHPDSEEVLKALREARRDKDDKRDAVNPFGRLVDMDNMGLKSNVVMNRELSKDEKLHDRQMVRSLSRDLLIETENCIQGIKDEVEPALLSISRTLAEGGVSPANVLTSIDKLQNAITSIREKRKKMADQQGIPPYVIFPDTTLMEMAYYFPQTKDDMLPIYGVGSIKQKKYGKDFLKIITDYCKEHDVEPRKKSLKKKKKESSKKKK
jgi:superfamily II DNA helicase RecQ